MKRPETILILLEKGVDPSIVAWLVGHRTIPEQKAKKELKQFFLRKRGVESLVDDLSRWFKKKTG